MSIEAMNNNTGVMRITRDGVWVNPDMQVDETAKAVLDALSSQVKVLVQKAVEDEREACADIAENWRCNGVPRTGVANEIRARGENMSIEAMKMAIEVLEKTGTVGNYTRELKAINALRQALEQAEKQEPDYWQEEARRYAGNADYWRGRAEQAEKQKPVGYVTDSGSSAWILKDIDLDDDTPIYAAPPHYWGNVTNVELVEELRRRDMLMIPLKENT